ncbi:hypothetical protein CVS40_6538 [Lucilia cuprina]|nr:hypothetical protein CVS40_6538 [Lucilia cuprina]
MLTVEYCHFTCSELSGLVAEAVSKNKDLHWCYESCRKFEIRRIRISAYGKLFDDFKSLHNLKSPPQSSPKRRKPARNLTKEKRDDQPTVSATPCNTSSDVPLTNISAPVHSCNTASDQLNSSKKTIFISRLASNTTSDSVDFCIKNLITVSMNLFERLLDPNFWPINTLVREYIYRSRPQTIAALPQRGGVLIAVSCNLSSQLVVMNLYLFLLKLMHVVDRSSKDGDSLFYLCRLQSALKRTRQNSNIDDFINFLYDMGLFQINGIRNEYSKLLDSIFVNDVSNSFIKRSFPNSSLSSNN